MVTDCNGDRYLKSKESNAVIDARLWVLRQVPPFKNKEWTSKTRLNYQTIEEYFVPQLFKTNPCLNGQKKKWSELEDEIRDNQIGIVGIYGKTWQKFHHGKDINETAFKAYCGILGLDWQDIIDIEIPVWKTLQTQLHKFDHRDCVTRYYTLVRKFNNLLSLCIQFSPEQKLSFHWLLRCLLESSSNRNRVAYHDFYGSSELKMQNQSEKIIES
ncbi:hypothetical protein POG22_12280 [Geitlerinema sp. CS-897]|nr:hypothetical protein [Geitlerinema sp. CS-897]